VRLRGYRFEPIVLALVALASLPPISLAGPQDRTRYELTRHLVLHHSLVIESSLFDRAVFDGHTYSDKAPGMSFLAVPGYELERVLGIAKAPTAWEAKGDFSVWLLRVLSSGVLFLVSVFIVGRLGERLAAGTGAATAAIFGVATLAGPLAPTFFEHDAAGAFAIAAFALAWLGRRARAIVFAGLCAGIAVLFQYATALIAVALLAYCVWRGRRPALLFLAGAIPPAIALGAYNWSAFGSPFHLSYRYVANRFTERQHHGFFGIGVPTLSGLKDALVGTRGLLTFSPVLLAAAIGLWLLWRRGTRAEALLATLVVALFLLLDAGYFLVYGGGSPGPRFFGPAVPFLALGLPCVLARWPKPVAVLAFASAVLTTVDALSWGVRPPEETTWFPTRNEISRTVWAWVVPDRNVGALAVLLCALAAVGVGTVGLVRR
jgi:phage shock protein PspC (stress-responsive transcriptional regulator)